MADSRRRDEKDGDVDGSVSDLEVKSDPQKDAENSSNKAEKDGTSVQAADGSEYESAEEEKVTDKNIDEDPLKHQEESFSELVDEEGGNEAIAETDDVDNEFLNASAGPSEEDEGGGKEEKAEECDTDDLAIKDSNISKGENNVVNIDVDKKVEECKDSDEEETGEDKVEEHDVDCEDEEDGDEEGEHNVEEDGDEEGEHNVEEDGDEEGEHNIEEDGDDIEGECEDSDDYVEEERQQGDGEECSPESAVIEKELDFDEDRRNPQYIPKKGIFYEHDDRNTEEVKEKEEEPTRDRKKKLWLDEGRWGHDRFRLEEQYPKSKHELIETYGYDIRNEDGPPRARRRRRYGRGPTKYERNWEDVTAYAREKFRGAPQGISRGHRSRGPHLRGAPRFSGQVRREFNSEISNNKPGSENEQDNESDDLEAKESEISNVPIINNAEFPALPTKESVPEPEVLIEKRPFFQKSSSETPESTSVRTLTFENSSFSGRNSMERDTVPPRRGKTAPFNNYQPNDRNVRGNRRPVSRGGRTGRGENNRRGRGNNMRHISPRFLENKVNSLKLDLENLAINETNDLGNTLNLDVVNQIENNDVSNVASDSDLPSMALKGAGDSAGRPKRYSSLRQRGSAEPNSYQSAQQAVPAQHAPYYEAGYQPTLYAAAESGVPPSSTQSQSATSPPLLNPSAYQTFPPTPYTDSYGIRLPVTTPPPRLFPQATVPAGQPILTAPPPPPCIPPNANMINFPPSSGYHQFAYQQYAQPPPPPPAPPNEMYQPGITYYYPHTQPTSIRPTVQKRPKAAIPILPPPERDNKRKEKESSIHKTSSNAVNGEVSLRTESTSQSQSLPSVGVES